MVSNRPDRWLIFGGIPAAMVSLLFVIFAPHGQIEHAVGETALPYVLFFTPVAVVIVAMILYPRFPKSLVIPCGIAGWAIHAALLCWYFWFGPGAFGHQ